MYVLTTTWQVHGYIQKSQDSYEKYEDLVLRVSHFEPLLIGDESIRLINVEIFYFPKEDKNTRDL